MGGPQLEFINIQPKKGGPPLEFINQRGSASRFHQLDGGPPLEFININLSDDCRLRFDQLYCINELLANYFLLVSKILLGYEEALWPKNWR